MFTPFQVTDYVENGRAHGPFAQQLSRLRYDMGFMRPYLDKRDNVCITINTGEFEIDDNTGDVKPVRQQVRVAEAVARNAMDPLLNATTMRKDDWIFLDRQIQKAARPRLSAWSDARKAATFSIPGMSNSILEFEKWSDSGQANVDMYDLTGGNVDTPLVARDALPLPITHAGFNYSQREIGISASKGVPISTTMGEQASRRVADTIEKTIIGTLAGLQFGDSTELENTSKVYGYTNHPDRITKTDLTTPTSVNSSTVLAEVLVMLDLAKAQNFFGPFMLYTTNDWDQFMDQDYVKGTDAQGLASPSLTLRERIQRIEGVTAVKRLDFWDDTTSLLLVNMQSETIRAVNGMELTTVRWDSVGTMMKNFRVMAIQVPNIRSQFIGTSQTVSKTGIVHGTPA